MHPKALLDACAELLAQVLTFEHPADAVVARYFRDRRQLGPRERATLADVTYAVLRNKLLLEQLARSGSGARERRLAILGFARVQDEQARAADAQAVRGPRDYLHGALTEPERQWLAQCDAVPPGDLLAPHRHNLPEWLVAPLKGQLGEEGFWALAASLATSAPLHLRVNTLKAKREQARKELAQAAIETQASPYSPWGLHVRGKPALGRVPAFASGAVEVQDEGSQLLALLLDAKRGEMVADFCAGAGGKTLAIGAAMRSTGRLYAFDVSAHRLEGLKPRLARSGLSNVHPVAIAHERDERIKRLAGKMDRVLVDAPCSGLGTLRRSPDLKWRQTPAAVAELTRLQAAILASAARLVKPGGRLVYATCSLLPDENEAIAEAFGQAHADFAPLQVAELLAGLKVEQAASLCSGGEDGGRFLRLWPHLHGTDGFFAAVWQRK
ncbi:RsmB/NOP family class I SAM-dependent RNA methyltransferase [Pulveribacter suum]|uniref:SAM-dependent methyltransferase n=1 Tax=Pulveribacter suum TaxID=2116657 RepID=A0A2P1NJF0_9BURK|nr:RsmB/NOP family class I SAM-dependent RNA methyltransferase [Pulveribacter suum]AVP57146.1 SAM-dependent methyltransferase [Pulveribacter suum]